VQVEKFETLKFTKILKISEYGLQSVDFSAKICFIFSKHLIFTGMRVETRTPVGLFFLPIDEIFNNQKNKKMAC
jgi:hypothetical protein